MKEITIVYKQNINPYLFKYDNYPCLKELYQKNAYFFFKNLILARRFRFS